MPQAKILTSSLTLLLIVSCCADACGQNGRRNRSSWRDRASLKHIVFKADQPLESKAVADAIYSIYLPKTYDAKANAAKRYPVIYFLHGMFEDHNRFGTRGGAKVLDQAIGKKTLPEVIFVCAYDGNRRSFYVDNGRSKVETMIVKDLVPFIDKKFRTLADRDHRVLMGVSMGGFGAMKIAFKNPDVFGVLATHSAAILPAASKDIPKMFPWAHQRGLAASVFGNPIDQKMWDAENPLVIAKNVDVTQLTRLKIYFDCGDEDRYRLYTTNLQMHDALKKRKVPHSWTLVKGGNHGWNTRDSDVGYNNANLPNSLAFVGAALRDKDATKPGKAPVDGGRDSSAKTSKK
jgi:enterochelin esterase-like enzyme